MAFRTMEIAPIPEDVAIAPKPFSIFVTTASSFAFVGFPTLAYKGSLEAPENISWASCASLYP